MSRRCPRVASFLVLAAASAAAFAGHPMLSEDTGTQGSGNFELELGFDWSRQRGDRNFLFQPQLSWGAGPTLDLIVQPSWIVDDARAGSERGFGDTNLDLKWRFYGAAPWTLAIRAGASAPTAKQDLGPNDDRFSPHAILVATADFTPFAVDLNVGYALSPQNAAQRGDLYHFSGAVTYELARRLVVIVDTSVDSDPDRNDDGSFTALMLLGAIYTVRPGLDIDAGFRGRLSPSGPAQQWLLGITFRGAP